jgi:hypothetical protein
MSQGQKPNFTASSTQVAAAKRLAKHQRTASNSTSNSKVEFGGMTSPPPASP